MRLSGVNVDQSKRIEIEYKITSCGVATLGGGLRMTFPLTAEDLVINR